MLYVDQYSFMIASIEYLGALLCTIALVMDFSHKMQYNKKEKLFVRLILCFSMFSLTSDGTSYLLDLNAYENAILINKIILFIDFFSYLSAFFFMFLFTVEQLPQENPKLKKILDRIIYILMSVNYLMLLSNTFTNMLYIVDENNQYIKNWGLTIFTSILFVISLGLIVCLIIVRKGIEKTIGIPMIIGLSLLIVGGISELLLEDFPGTNIGIGISILFLYWFYRMKLIRENPTSSNRHMLLIMYLFLGMAFSIFLTYVINVSAIIRVSEENLKSTDETVANMIHESVDNMFVKPITVSETMAQSSNLKNGILLDADMEMDEVNQELVDYLASIRGGMDYQMVFAVSELNQKYYTYDGISKVIDVKNDKHDIWYKEFLELNKDYALNVDTDEANDWALSVFVNKKVTDDKGNLLGVCGVGVSMQSLQKMLAQYEEENDVRIYLVDADGLVKVASDGESIDQLTIKNSYFNKVNSKKFYYQNLDDKIRLTRYDEVLDWYIVVIDENPDKISVAKIIRPGLIAAMVSVLLMLASYFGINMHENRVKDDLLENKQKAEYLKKVSETDGLTNLLNRHAYESHKKEITVQEMKEDFLVMIMDVNGLKRINDTIGHDAGDELIIGAANCLVKVFSQYGNIYRIGGDEFAVVLNLPKDEFIIELEHFRTIVGDWKGEKIDELAIAVGYVYHSDYENLSFDELVKVADGQMYEDKRNYYKIKGNDRRR